MCRFSGLDKLQAWLRVRFGVALFGLSVHGMENVNLNNDVSDASVHVLTQASCVGLTSPEYFMNSLHSCDGLRDNCLALLYQPSYCLVL